jgi:hypothetical protein
MAEGHCYNDKMADDLKEIQIEIRWKRVVKQEAERKQNAYPWNLPLSPCKPRSVCTKRSESTEAESNRSDSPERILRDRVCTRPPALPKSIRKPNLPQPNDKENIHPSWDEGHKPCGPLLTFRKRDSLQPSLPLLAELPRQETAKPDYEQLLGFSPQQDYSEEELASTSGFLPKAYEMGSRASPEPTDPDISLTLDHFLDGVNQLKGDLRALQMAASISKPRSSLL